MPWPGAACDRPVQGSGEAGKKLDQSQSVDSKISGSPKALLFPRADDRRTVILNDYVEAATMLDYNGRDVAAAWY